MIRKRILSLLVCAALLCGVLAGCSTSSGSTAASSSSARLRKKRQKFV